MESFRSGLCLNITYISSTMSAIQRFTIGLQVISHSLENSCKCYFILLEENVFPDEVLSVSIAVLEFSITLSCTLLLEEPGVASIPFTLFEMVLL